MIVADSPVEQQGWQFSKGIDLQGTDPYHGLFLDEEVYAGANGDLSDLRIVDKKGQFVPYYIDSGYGLAKDMTKKYTSSLVHTAMKDGNMLLDYQITPEAEHKDIRGNLLSVELPEETFLKRIKVYGSYDGHQWQFIDQGDLYRTDQLVKNTIELGSEYKYEYYRLNVLNNVEKLIFPTLQLIHNTQERQWIDYKKLGKPSYEMKQVDKVTHIIVKNESRLQVTQLQLSTKSNNYKRSYKVYDDQDVRMTTAGSQDIYQLNFKDKQITNNTIMLETPTRSSNITIELNNHDNLPLDITAFEMGYIVDKIVFEDIGAGPYQLWYGKSDAIQPEYDIVNFKTYIEHEDVRVGKFQAQQIVQDAPTSEGPAPWWMQAKIWFNVVIILVSLMLIVLLVKKITPSK
ncbi:DUF3999 family protein [Paenibacillus sp. CMAA1364]